MTDVDGMCETFTDADGDEYTLWTGGRAEAKRVYLSSDSVVALSPTTARLLAMRLVAFAEHLERKLSR